LNKTYEHLQSILLWPYPYFDTNVTLNNEGKESLYHSRARKSQAIVDGLADEIIENIQKIQYADMQLYDAAVRKFKTFS
jgi:hypothetical protein